MDGGWMVEDGGWMVDGRWMDVDGGGRRMDRNDRRLRGRRGNDGGKLGAGKHQALAEERGRAGPGTGAGTAEQGLNEQGLH